MTKLQQTTTAAFPLPLLLPGRFARSIVRIFTGGWKLAKVHDLNPWVFIGMSTLGWLVHGMVYLPWFQGEAWQLTFLILLRVFALVVPIYIIAKGKRIALAFNASIAIMFTANTVWHVCYYVFL